MKLRDLNFHFGPPEDWYTRQRPAPWNTARSFEGIWYFRVVDQHIEAAEYGWYTVPHPTQTREQPRGLHFTYDGLTLNVGVTDAEESDPYEASPGDRPIPMAAIRRAMLMYSQLVDPVEKSYIYVDQHRLALDQPALLVKTGDDPQRRGSVAIIKHAGIEVARVVHRPSDPRPSGARAWVETDGHVVVGEEYKP